MILLVRRIVVISVVVLALLTSGVVVALAASGGESRPITKAQAVAFAQALNLRAGDLPASEWTTTGKEEELPLWSATVLTLCDASELPTGKTISAVVSPSLQLRPAPHIRNETVSSTVFVMSSVSAARAHVNAARKCVAARRRRPRSRHAVTFSRLAATVPGTQVAGRRMHVPNIGYVDILVFEVGHAEIELHVDAVASQPMPATTEQQLLSLLYSRAEAHKL